MARTDRGSTINFRITIEDPNGVLKLRRTDLRLWPAVIGTAETAVDEAKKILRRKIRHPELSKSIQSGGTEGLESAIRVLWQNKSMNMAKIGIDLEIAPYGEYVEAGHYFAENSEFSWSKRQRERVYEEGKPAPRIPGYWFIRDGTRIAMEKAQPYLEKTVVDMQKYKVGPRGGIYDAGTHEGELKVYRRDL